MEIKIIKGAARAEVLITGDTPRPIFSALYALAAPLMIFISISNFRSGLQIRVADCAERGAVAIEGLCLNGDCEMQSQSKDQLIPSFSKKALSEGSRPKKLFKRSIPSAMFPLSRMDFRYWPPTIGLSIPSDLKRENMS